MFSNRELVEVYLKNRDSENVLAFLNQNLTASEDVINRSLKLWVKTFKTLWRSTGSKERFFDRKTRWLDAPFMVSSLDLLLRF